MIDDGGYDPPQPFLCIACSTARHDLCSAPPHVYCECSETSHDLDR